jgi:uncharacterized membrane protein YfcA
MLAARWLSIIAHPFVMVGVMVGTAVARRRTPAEALRSVAMLALVVIVPLLILMTRKVRSGDWENADASNKKERPVLYLVGALALVGLLASLTLFRTHHFMVRGAFATLLMFGACAVATRWIKLSLHMAFAALAATALSLMGLAVGYALLLMLPALAWARLALSRHTPFELALGTLAGATAGAAIHYL